MIITATNFQLQDSEQIEDRLLNLAKHGDRFKLKVAFEFLKSVPNMNQEWLSGLELACNVILDSKELVRC